MGNIYVGANDVDRKIKGAYIGVDGVARKVKQIYVGVDGVARLVWSAIPSVLTLFSQEQKFTSIQNCNVAKEQLNGGISPWYYYISMDPTKTMVTYLYLNGVKWSNYSKLTVKYNLKNSTAWFGNLPTMEGYTNNIGSLLVDTTSPQTATFDIAIPDNDYLIIYVIAESQYDPTDFTFIIYELLLS